MKIKNWKLKIDTWWIRALILILAFLLLIVLVWSGTYSLRHKASNGYYKTAIGLLGSNQYDTAVTNLNYATALDSTNHKAHYQLGEIQRSFADYARARSSFRQAYIADPRPKYLLGLFEVDYKIGDRKILERDFSLDIPDQGLLAFLTWLECMKYEQDHECLSILQSIKDSNERKYLESLTYLAQDDFDEFTNRVDALVQTDSGIDTPEFVKWQMYPTKNNIKVLQKLKASLAGLKLMESKQVFAYKALNDLGYSLLSVDLLEDLTAVNLKFRDAHLVLAESYYLELKYEDAQRSAKVAEKLGYNHLPTLRLLEQIYTAIDQSDSAEDYQNRIRELGL
jgi:Tfp pilus assembly protein PilF